MDNLSSLVELFVTATINQHTALAAYDHKLANKHFRLSERYICQIKLIPDWEKSILPLLSHEHIAVRINAASILLPYETKRAEYVLKQSRFAPGIDGFNAKMILNEWKSGELKFPVLENGKISYKKVKV